MNATDWFVIATNTACERRASQGLMDAGFEVWFPTRVVEIRVGPRREKRDRTFPLYPGYLFIRLAGADCWQRVIGIDGVKAVLCNDWAPLRISADRMERLRAQCAPLAMPLVEDAWVIGDKLRITDGPFATFPSVLERLTEGTPYIRVRAMIFGRETAIDLERGQVERVA